MTRTINRRALAGYALIAAPVFKLASVLVWPTQGKAAVELRSAAAHPAAWTAATFLWLAFVACIGAGTLGLAQLVRSGRGARLVQGGSGMVLLAMLAWGGAGALALQEIVLAREPNRGAMLALDADMRHSSGLFVYVLLIMLGELALVAVFAGLRRARLVPLWQPLAMVGAIVLDIAGDTKLLGVLESGLLVLALGTAASALLGPARSTVKAKALATAALLVLALALPAAAMADDAQQPIVVVAKSYSDKTVGKRDVFKEILSAHGRRVGHDVVSCLPHGKKMVCH